MSETGQLPQSSALAEASLDSLSEVMSRDPEGLSRQDRDRIIEALRANRARLAIADASPERKKPRTPKATVPLSTKSSGNPEDLGF